LLFRFLGGRTRRICSAGRPDRTTISFAIVDFIFVWLLFALLNRSYVRGLLAGATKG
jgi:hypothetical protein